MQLQQTGLQTERQVGRGRLAMSWIVTPHGLEARWLLDESAPIDTPPLAGPGSDEAELSPAA
jgi:hypothetical protein